MDDDLVFNGLNGATGGYLFAPTTADVARQAEDDFAALNASNAAHVRELRQVEENRRVVDWVADTDLSQSGWGVIFADDAAPETREALQELLDYRKGQVNDETLYREYVGKDGYHGGEAKKDFLNRRGAPSDGLVDPQNMPYYLLIVGDPQRIPYSFQYGLDVQYAVGRIAFDTPDEYARYAHSVVAAEKANPRPRRLAVFAPQNDGDKATAASVRALATPLQTRVRDQLAKRRASQGWDLQAAVADDAKKARLAALLGGGETPALLFSASHGIAFPNGDPRQLPHQGAPVCQDWPGPEAWGEQPIPQDFYLAADDIGDDADVFGMVVFLFACYGAGTPQLDDYPQLAARAGAAPLGLPLAQAIAPHAFVARLPQQLLAHPKGGALAVVGHVERALTSTFAWTWLGKENSNVDDYLAALALMAWGAPVGRAMEAFNQRYAETGVGLSDAIRKLQAQGVASADAELASAWSANTDARGFVVLGDPAVRLTAFQGGGGP